MQVVLVMFRGEERRSFSITRDLTVIGRREDCDFRIPLGEISRKHCRLIKEEGGLKVEDLGSSNGTFVNGQRVQEASVQAGDTLQVGSVAFVLQIDGAPADEELEPLTAGSRTTVAPAAPVPPSEHLNPTAQTDAADAGDQFDPMAALAPTDDSSVSDAIIDSNVGDDIMIDLGGSRAESA